VGGTYTVEEGYQAARLCALNLLAHLKVAAGGDLDRVSHALKLVGFVNCPPDFGDQPKVINGASELIVQVFGEAGHHARSAVGSVSLPLGVAVEVEGVFELL
jgi:enamine deaminase RidA (YjgF/YER057c/UK114 family)